MGRFFLSAIFLYIGSALRRHTDFSRRVFRPFLYEE
jgi:hypothetical protein